MNHDNRKRPLPKVDYQTISLFVSLAVLTILFVLGMHWALFAPTSSVSNNAQAIEATK